MSLVKQIRHWNWAYSCADSRKYSDKKNKEIMCFTKILTIAFVSE